MDKELITGLDSEQPDESKDSAADYYITPYEDSLITLERAADFDNQFNEDEAINNHNVIELYDTVIDISGNFFHTELEIEGLDHLSISEGSMAQLAEYSNRVY